MSERKLQKILNAIASLKDDADYARKHLDNLILGQESLHVKFDELRLEQSSLRNVHSDLSLGAEPRKIGTERNPVPLRKGSMDSISTRSSLGGNSGGNVWPASIRMREGVNLLGVWSEDFDNSWLGFQQRTTTHYSNFSIQSFKSLWQKFLPKVSALANAIEPDSNILTLMDVFGLIALVNDIIITPFVIAWDLPMHRSISVFARFAALYWTCDMIVNFRVGYFHHGELTMENIDIMWRYLRRSFLLDFVLLLYDWLFLASDAVQKIIVLRILRIIKIFRIFRLIKLADKVEHWSTSNTWRVAMLIFKVFATVLILNHLVSCTWFIVGTRQVSDTGKRWVFHTPFPWEEKYDFFHMNLMYQYVVTNHWITAEMSLAGVHIEPANSVEGIISIFLLIVGLLVGGTIAGVFSSQIVEMHEAQREKIEQLATLRHFLTQRRVHPKLAYRVQKQAESRLKRSAPLVEEDVGALELISSSLRTRLLIAMRSPYMLSHSLFQVWKTCEPDAVEILCEHVKFVFFSPQDVLFEAHKLGSSAYYLVGKRMLYIKTATAKTSAISARSKFHITEDVTLTVDQGSWLSESAWWSEWLHVGTCEAVTHCQVLVVSAKSLLGIARAMPAVGETTKDYGSSFYIRIISAQPPYSDFPDDLNVPFTDPSDLLSNDIGIDILTNAQKDGTLNLSKDEFDEFQNEIIEGKCALQRRLEDRSLERIVAVAAVRLARDDGHVFVQVGKWDPTHGIKPCSLLPGTKRKRGELPHEAMSRILETDLSVLKDEIVIGRTKTEMFMKEAKWGVRTKYLRTECNATLPRCFEIKALRVEPPYWLQRNLPIPPREVYILKDGDKELREKNLIFAWLSENEFIQASLPGNACLLDPWLSVLDIPCENLDEPPTSAERVLRDSYSLDLDTDRAQQLPNSHPGPRYRDMSSLVEDVAGDRKTGFFV